MHSSELKFHVIGSQGNEYEVIFHLYGDRVSSYCTCKSAEYDALCRHILMILSGDDTDLVSDNLCDLYLVANAFKNSSKYSLYQRMLHANDIAEQAKKDAGYAKRQLGKSIVESFYLRGVKALEASTAKAKRNELQWVTFGADGYASGWFFLVHSAFKGALDICLAERSVKKVKRLVETEGSPMCFSFSRGDSANSRCGNWSIQIDQSTFDTIKSPGNVGFMVYTKHQPMNAHEGVWRQFKWLSTSQQEFVALLMSGACQSIDLKNSQ